MSSLLFLVSILAISCPAQVDRGGIVGVVTDPAGAVVAGAQVTVTNLETNQSTTLTTDDQGNYAAKLLRIGMYSVAVEKAGFQKAIEPRVDVGVNQVVRVDLALKVGSINETMEITTAAPLLQTEASSLGTIETTKRISDLPLNGRNFIQLAYLGPGANSGQTGSNVSGQVFENERANEAVSVNGLRVSNNNFLLNGVDNNEFGLGGTVALPPPDAIQEFRTEENSMSAEFGRGGAAVNVVLKSGTNQVHGGVYEFIRNSAIDARNYFNREPDEKPSFQRNQFGFFLGGPIKKDRTFIFGDYEGSRLREGGTFTSTIPNATERLGDFRDRLTGDTFSPCGDSPAPGDPAFDTGTIFDPGTTHNYTCLNGAGQVSLRDPISFNSQVNVIPPTMIDPVGSNVANLFPAPTNGDLANNYVATQKHINNQDQFDVRVDHRFRDQDQVFASYSFGDIRSARPGPLGDLGGSDCCPSRSNSRAQHLGLGYTHTFSPRVLNDLHGGYFRYAVNALPFNFGKNLGEQLGIPNANRAGDPNSSGLTNIDIAGFTSLGDSEFLPEHAFENIFQVADTVTWVRGKHSLKFGLDFRRQQRNFYQVTAPRGFYDFGGLYTADLTTGTGGLGLADLLLGVSDALEQDKLAGLYPTRYWDLAEFVQDDWRIRPNLTLNLGLRYEITSPANGRVGNFDLNRGIVITSYGVNAVSHAGVQFDKSNWAPRIGLAWSLPRNTVVRSAFGMFYSAEANIFDDLGLNPTQLNFIQTFFNPGDLPSNAQLVSTGFPDEFPASDPININGTVKTTGPKRLIPRILEWNLTVQHQFGSNWVAQAGYVGTRAYRLWNHEASDLNQPLQPLDSNFSGGTNAGRPYFNQQPNLSFVLPLDFAQLHMLYNAFQASLNKRFSNGFNFLAAYTFAKNLGNADGNVGGFIQDSHHPEREYGPVSPDLRHRVSLSYLYELPIGKGRRYLGGMGNVTEAIFGGWQVGGITAIQSGEAVTAVLSSDLSNSGSFSYRPDQVRAPADFSFDTSTQQALGCPGGRQTLDCWYNQAVFVEPPLAPGQQFAHQFGNSHIGNLRGPDLVNFDFVLQKNFKIRESNQVEFRAEFFNFFNHPNFGLPGTEVDSVGGASITSTATDNRQVEFALKYTF